MADEVLGYIVDIVAATRALTVLAAGCFTARRPALLATARSWAWLSGRNYVTPDDVKAMARPTLRHRVSLGPEAELEGANPDERPQRHTRSRAGAALVILAGRAGAWWPVATCVLPITISPWPAITFAVLLAALVAIVAVDVGLYGQHTQADLQPSRRDCRASSASPSTRCVVVNTSRRFTAGEVRDAWAPSARAEPRTHAVNLAAVGTTATRHTIAADTPRRPGPRACTARSIGPLAGRSARS